MDWKRKRNGSSCFMQVFLILLALENRKCNAQQDLSWNWTHPVKETTLNENGNLVTVDHIKFKRRTFRYTAYGKFFTENSCTKLKCGILCMENLRCISWLFVVQWQKCYLYDYKLEAYPLKAFIKSKYTSSHENYEIESPCTQNQNLCEHGSHCSPNRLLGTYECINCLLPYTGKHCNETGPPSSITLSKDILYGRKASCLLLHFHFGIASGCHWIHPWRDERKIQVFCSGGYTKLSSKKQSDTSPMHLITSNEFQDGLEICTGNHIVDTSFLRLFLSLTPFIRIQYECTSSSGKTYVMNNDINASKESENYRNYFSNNKIDRPECTGLSPESTLQCDDIKDELLSSNNVTVSERAYKDIFVLKNGTRMSMTDDYPECFEGTENIDFMMRVK